MRNEYNENEYRDGCDFNPIPLLIFMIAFILTIPIAIMVSNYVTYGKII